MVLGDPMMAATKPRWLHRLALASAIALTLGYLPHHIYGKTGLARLLRNRRALMLLHERNTRARDENARLRAQAAALRSDPLELERVARDELGLVKQGEVVYQLDDSRAPRLGPR
jgi:cell division protein FtsB